MSLHQLHIVRMNRMYLLRCIVCGEVGPCSHLDHELKNVVCRDCVMPVKQAELQLTAWLNHPDPDQAIEDLSAVQSHMRGHWNARPGEKKS